MDRCSCVGHCECSCLFDSRDEERCQPMSKERYQAAGFRGPPLIKRVEPPTWPTDVVTIVCLVLFALLLLFLLLGTDRKPIRPFWALDEFLCESNEIYFLRFPQVDDRHMRAGSGSLGIGRFTRDAQNDRVLGKRLEVEERCV
ncbi:hypothetical protein K0M31_016828 [Melipona bicolor]|uniref:Uncharacterized protein n=1 Tax=Melipona bicolor TaxID=60889 RepID=A0AA40FE42_9HYME|nr:hypothetical protein K0M31_016828 [Melipona bicolor]